MSASVIVSFERRPLFVFAVFFVSIGLILLSLLENYLRSGRDVEVISQATAHQDFEAQINTRVSSEPEANIANGFATKT